MIKVMTYNIMSGKKYFKQMEGFDFNDSTINDPHAAAKVIKRQNADIVVLNEVRDMGGDYTAQTEEIAKLCGYPYYYFAKAIMAGESPYGNAIVSKYPIVSKKTIIVETQEIEKDMAETRSIAHVTVDIDGKKLDVLGTHFGLLDSEKNKMLQTLTEIIKANNNPIVLMGDFNCMPSSEYSTSLRELMTDTMFKYGDNYSTYFGPHMPHSLKKIDYIYVSNDIKYSNAGVVTESASDHFPCVATLEI